jgi:GAF domain-containing protein
MIASAPALSDILETLCRFAEEAVEGCRCGIYLVDWSGPRILGFAAPSLPASFSLPLCAMPLHQDAGPCARAACLKAPVIAADLDSDPSWRTSAFRDLAAAHGLRSCWSVPICAAAGYAVGTLAILHDRPARPTSRQEDLVGRLAHIAGIAIGHAQAAADGDNNNAELARAAGIMALGASLAGDITQPLSGMAINASTGLRMLTNARPDVEGVRETLRRTLRDCDRASAMIAQLRVILRRQETPALGRSRNLGGWSGAS